VVDQFSTARAHPALGHTVLPRTSRCDPLRLRAEIANGPLQLGAKTLVAIEDEVLWGGVEWEGFANLLRDPRRIRMLGYRKMHELASSDPWGARLLHPDSTATSLIRRDYLPFPYEQGLQAVPAMTTVKKIRAFAAAAPWTSIEDLVLPEELLEATEADLFELLQSEPDYALLEATLAIAAMTRSKEAIVGMFKVGFATRDPSIVKLYYQSLGLQLDAETDLRLLEELAANDRQTAGGACYWMRPLFWQHYPEQFNEFQRVKAACGI
jgi:hypothetical protein